MAGDGIKVGGAGIDALVNDMKSGLAKLEQRLETMKGDLKPYVEQCKNLGSNLRRFQRRNKSR